MLIPKKKEKENEAGSDKNYTLHKKEEKFGPGRKVHKSKYLHNGTKRRRKNKSVTRGNSTFLKKGGKNSVPRLKKAEKILSPNFGQNCSRDNFSQK